MTFRFLTALLLLSTASAARAEVQICAIFSDHMVMQRDAPVPVWGRADADENVTVAFAGQTKNATAAADGKWLVTLDPMSASTEPRALTLCGKNTLVISDVLVGEVWLCGGQSNMEWSLENSTGGSEAIAAAQNPLLRLARVEHHSQLTPQTNAPVSWRPANPASTKTYSAIAYWFGERLQKELGVPVGIINNSYGGTVIQSWLPLETLRAGSWPQDKRTDLALAKADYDRRVAEKQPEMDRFLAEKTAAQKERRPAPAMFAGWPGEFRGPGVLWNGEVAPLLPFRLRGVAWYQGESNAYAGGPARPYREMLRALIRDWRAGFQQPELPFLIFQIARNRQPQTDPNERSGIAELQEAQLKVALEVPHTALVVTTDLGERNVHYPNKSPAADRAVKAALALAYGRDVKHAGPVLREATFANGKAVLRFDHAGGGLVAHEGELKGFVIAADDQKFVFAEARSDGDTVIVSSAQVPKPVAVRYGWADLPQVNLFNGANFPASPFRTDSWPLDPELR
jgi:sialate O-acetylesterase